MVRTNTPTFGIQPFFCLKTTTDRFLHDNLDCQTPFSEWTYVFDEHSIPLSQVAKIGLAANDSTGNVAVSVLDLISHNIDTTVL